MVILTIGYSIFQNTWRFLNNNDKGKFLYESFRHLLPWFVSKWLFFLWVDYYRIENYSVKQNHYECPVTCCLKNCFAATLPGVESKDDILSITHLEKHFFYYQTPQKDRC